MMDATHTGRPLRASQARLVNIMSTRAGFASPFRFLHGISDVSDGNLACTAPWHSESDTL